MSNKNDLIKRSDVLSILKENGWLDDTPLEDLVNEVPTAFNMDKVVEEIRETVPLYISKVVGIVEKGGIEENKMELEER